MTCQCLFFRFNRVWTGPSPLLVTFQLLYVITILMLIIQKPKGKTWIVKSQNSKGLPFLCLLALRLDRWILFSKGFIMREIVHLQAGQCGNQIGAKVGFSLPLEQIINTYLTRSAFYFIVLGSDLRWTWRRPNWHISRRFRPSVRKNKRLL
jgi:hypothetical protein